MTRLKRQDHKYLNDLNTYLKKIHNKLAVYGCGLHTDVKYDDIEQIIRIDSRIRGVQEEISDLRNYLDPDYVPGND